jgi:hypothetical protein
LTSPTGNVSGSASRKVEAGPHIERKRANDVVVYCAPNLPFHRSHIFKTFRAEEIGVERIKTLLRLVTTDEVFPKGEGEEADALNAAPFDKPFQVEEEGFSLFCDATFCMCGLRCLE